MQAFFLKKSKIALDFLRNTVYNLTLHGSELGILCLFTDCKYGFHNEPQLYREYLEQGADTHGKRGKNGSDI